MTAGLRVTEEMLHAYADGQLSADERAAVEAWLIDHPEQADEVANWQRQNEALNALFAPIAKEPIPARLGPQLIAARRSPAPTSWSQLAAAAMVVLALGGAIGWFGRQYSQPAESQSAALIDNAVVAHALYVKEKRHAVEVAADEEEHLVSWLSNRLTTPIEAPDMTTEGFSLVGGRLLPEGLYTEAGPAAQLMYENSAAERLTVYITAATDGAEAFEFTSRDGYEAFYWANDQITCTVVGDLPETEMQTVARRVFQQLTRRPDYRRGT